VSSFELRFGVPLIQNPRVVEPLVRIRELLKDLFGFPETIGTPAGELVCKSKPK
jgi:hypothetical protein